MGSGEGSIMRNSIVSTIYLITIDVVDKVTANKFFPSHDVTGGPNRQLSDLSTEKCDDEKEIC